MAAGTASAASTAGTARGRTSPGLRAFCAALLPPGSGGPDPGHLAVEVDAYLDRLPAATRVAARSGFAAAGAALRVAGRGRGDPLARLAGARGDVALAIDGLKALVLLVEGADRFTGEIRGRARAEGLARPDPDLAVTASAAWPSRSRADAVVVGSGAGGAMVARTLARAGLDVVVVEEGRRWSVDDLRELRPIDRYAGLYRDGGATVAVGSPPVVLPVGRAVGGSTVVNSGTCYRPPLRVQRTWRDRHGLEVADPDRLAGYLDEVEATLQVGPVPLDVMGANGQALLAGARELGWRAGPLQRNAPGCGGCCQCALGCPRNAKFGVHLNALPDACRAGARILSEATVQRVLHERGRVTGVRARRPDGSAVEVSAPTVVVAAGATETPGLLWRSGLGGHPEMGRNLAVHPALGAAGRFEEPVVPWDGVLQSAAVEEWHESDGILVEATATPPGMGSMALPGFGPELLGWQGRADHLATLGAMIGDGPSGRVVRRGPGTLLRYRLSDRDGRRLLRALSIMGEVLLAAGATEVLTGVPGAAPVRSLGELEEVLAVADPRRLHLAAFHPTGTVRAGSEGQRSPVDPAGRLRGVEGVWVADASIVPSCPDVNPQVSIMALALAVGDRVVRARG